MMTDRSEAQRAEVDRDPFPYDRLLAFYRGRVSDEKEVATIKSRISKDERWHAHWESIRHLDSERDIAQHDAEQLQRMQMDRSSQFCRAVARSNGDVLIPYLLSDTEQELIEGRPVHEWDKHIDECVYCRRMRRRVYAMLQWDQALPPGEKVLRDWLLEDYYQSELDEITRTLQPNAKNALDLAAQRVDNFIGQASANKVMLGMQDEFVAHLGESLEQLRTIQPTAVRPTIPAYDPLWFTAAGGGSQSEIITTTPLWFTCLMEPPARLRWRPARSQGPWHVRVWSARTGELFENRAHVSECDLPASVRDRMPRESDIRWEVRDTNDGEKDPPLVRGVFRLLGREKVASMQRRLSDIFTMRPDFHREMAVVMLCDEHGLYDTTLNRLDEIKESYGHGADGFLVYRARTSVYLAVQRELTGKRRLGDPEGTWANTLAKEALQTAYKVL